MTHVRKSSLPLMLASVATGCSTMSNTVTTLEARGALASGSDSADDPPGGYFAEPGSGPAIYSDGGNVHWRSYGLRAALNTSPIDVIGGVDRHRFEDRGATEASLGLRKRLDDATLDGLYIEAALRRGFDLDTVAGRRNYDGMETSVGAIFHLDKNWFLDLACTVEWTFDRLDVGDGRERLSDVLFSVAIGFAF